MSYDDLIQWTGRAQSLLEQAVGHWPVKPFWYESIKRQLTFVHDLAEKKARPTKQEIASLTMGRYAVREFEDTYPELSDAICQVLDRLDRL